MEIGIFLTIAGLVLGVLLWLFKPDFIRRWLGLDTPIELDLYPLSGRSDSVLRADPVIGSDYSAAVESGCEFVFHPPQTVPLKLSEGFEHFRTPEGAKCVSKGNSDEFFLLVRRVFT